MNTNKLSEYKLSENSVLSESDKKHIENYKQLIKFFENAIESSIKDSTVNYSSLHNSCIQCIRFLDNLIFTYDSTLQSARNINQTLEKIIQDNKENKDHDLGNES